MYTHKSLKPDDVPLLRVTTEHCADGLSVACRPFGTGDEHCTDWDLQSALGTRQNCQGTPAEDCRQCRLLDTKL